MPIITPCACGKKLRTKDEFAGKRIKCPACGTILTVLASVDDRPLQDAFDEEQDTVELSAEQTRNLPPAKEPFWINPRGSDNLIALTDTALYVASLDDRGLTAAQAALEKGEAVWKVLKEAKTIIAFDEIERVESDLQESAMEIAWKKDKSGRQLRSKIACADTKARDEIMDVLHERLGKGWRMQETEQSRLRAAALPLAACAILLLLGVYEVFFFGGMPWLPVVILIPATFVICAAWLVARVHTPPVLLTIARAPK